jgi:hypothetical protein
MNRYDTRTPRVALALVAVILSALTLGTFGLLPAVSESAGTTVLAALSMHRYPPIH